VRRFEVRFLSVFAAWLVWFIWWCVGETIPIRLFLGGFDLTPTFREVNKKFSTRYYLNLVLIDEENRRYFKQQVRRSLGFFSFMPVRC
jgi:hypothetical protein